MSRMVRKQVYITPEQNRLLKRRAKDLQVPEAAVVRKGIELASRSSAPPPFNRKALEALKRAMQQRARMKVPQTGRNWTRDELYDERIERFSRR